MKYSQQEIIQYVQEEDVKFILTFIKYELFQRLLIRQAVKTNVASGCRIVYGNYRIAPCIKLWSYFHFFSIYHTVFSAI